MTLANLLGLILKLAAHSDQYLLTAGIFSVAL
jgi:hypothetical protein